MPEKKYLLGGWVPPILHPRDPDYCEYGCPVCRGARRGNGVARMLQKMELTIIGGGCPWGRARREKYGVAPDESRRSAADTADKTPETPDDQAE